MVCSYPTRKQLFLCAYFLLSRLSELHCINSNCQGLLKFSISPLAFIPPNNTLSLVRQKRLSQVTPLSKCTIYHNKDVFHNSSISQSSPWLEAKSDFFSSFSIDLSSINRYNFKKWIIEVISAFCMEDCLTKINTGGVSCCFQVLQIKTNLNPY